MTKKSVSRVTVFPECFYSVGTELTDMVGQLYHHNTMGSEEAQVKYLFIVFGMIKQLLGEPLWLTHIFKVILSLYLESITHIHF